MNYSPYDLKTRPVSEHPLENPTNPEEIPSLEYPSREEPGRFYADQSDEERADERTTQSGVELAGDEVSEMDFDSRPVEPYYEGADVLAAHSGPGLRH